MSLIIAYLGIMSVLVIALNARFLGEMLGVMDDPSKEAHKKHIISTPLVGALMVSSLAIFILLNHYFFQASTRMVGISVCTILVGILGLFDDRLRLSWQVRLILIGAISSLLVFWVPELRLDNLMWSFGYTTELGRWPGAAFTVLCLMTLVISFNMMDGFNGGVIGISLVLMVLMALVATNPHRQAICLFLTFALGVMFVYNIKGEFFLGDGGAYALGLLVGSIALLTYNVGANITIYADTIFLWLAIPTLDCLRVVIKRRLGKENPFYAGRDHLHHLLMAISGPKRTLLFYLSNAALFGSMSLISDTATYILFLTEVAVLLGSAKYADQRLAIKPAE
ncbi:MraY family glycosyltransferase [Kordiimonas aquimaris]|uniref:MraY family glycosyltransferase n=1 Tax=Kordiimonas aquimaris TaxID=707591 RepID=UPI0021CEDEDE|nr:MraY family glycosyltransferase [Kordiimonas aquimaris]